MEGDGKEGLKLAVDVPAEFEAVFIRAQRYVERYFSDRVEDPVRGIIELAGERYILVRAASMSIEFFDLVVNLYRERGEQEAREVASAFLFDIAHAVGKADARMFHRKMGVDDPIEKLSAGPIHFAFSGWAKVSISPDSNPSPDDDFLLLYEHPYSFEADSWLRAGKGAEIPVCIMNAGYSSGWCEESFGISLIAVEVSCRAAGGNACRFVMAPPGRIHEHLREHAGKRPDGERAHALEVPEFFKRKRLEEELRRHREQLEDLVAERTRELTNANQQLRLEIEERQRVQSQLLHAQKMEAIGTLASGVAHDFNNMLTTVMVSVQLALRHSEDSPKAIPWLRDAKNAVERAADLTKQLLYLGRPSEQKMEPVDAAETLARVSRFLRRTIPENITIEVDVPTDEVVVRGDATQLEQAVINLAINARDAMPDGGAMTLRVERVHVQPHEAEASPEARAGWFACIAVSDTGMGVPKDLAERIFEPFFTTKAPGRGTGLGLAMVYGCARAHDGWVTVDSEPGSGAVFRVYLPLSSEHPIATVDLEQRLPSGTETVLLVDDTDAVLCSSQNILESCGYKVVTASDGRAALAHAEQLGDELAVVVTDLVMPGMDGRGLLSGLRARGSKVPVILTSGHAVGHDAADLVAKGFATFVAKPFDALALARIVRQIIDER